jgi:hypothetical protein
VQGGCVVSGLSLLGPAGLLFAFLSTSRMCLYTHRSLSKVHDQVTRFARRQHSQFEIQAQLAAC